MHEPLFRSRGDTNVDLFFIYFIRLIEFDPSEEGFYRPEEEEIGSHIAIHSQERERREESPHGAVGRAQ